MRRVLFLAVCLICFSCTVYGQPIKTVHQGIWSSTDARFLAENRDILVSSGGENYINSLRQYNQEIEILYYFNAVGVHESDPLWQEIQGKNIIWTDSNGVFVHHKQFNWYLMDIRSEEWATTVLNYLSQHLTYYDGVMLDESALLWAPSFDSMPQDYNEREYHEALNTLFSRIKIAFPDKKIVFNGHKRWTDATYNGLNLLGFTDGISFEGFSYRFDGEYVGETALISSLIDFYRSTQVLRKQAVFVDVCASTEMEKRMFSLATFMLVQSENSFYYFVPSDLDAHIGAQDWPEYYLDLGNAQGVVHQTHGVLVREFSKGIVVVNPGSQTVQYDLGVPVIEKLIIEGGGSIIDPGTLDWKSISGFLELAPESAIIFRF